MRLLLTAALVLTSANLALAQAPGVDPIQLERFEPLKMRGGPAQKFGPAVRGDDGMPRTPGSDAKLARFTAKIMTLGKINPADEYVSNVQIQTYRDQASSVCIMDIGSSTGSGDGFSRYGPSGDSAQPVLIRGNVLNVCQ